MEILIKQNLTLMMKINKKEGGCNIDEGNKVQM